MPIASMYPSDPFYEDVAKAEKLAEALEAREVYDRCLDTLDTVESLNDRCECLVVAAEVLDGKGGLECRYGFKGHPDDIADALAQLMTKYTDAPEGGYERLANAIMKAKIRQQSKTIQRELDRMDAFHGR